MLTNTNPKNSNRLTEKDLINVGIYSAIYFVVIMATAMLGYIPIMMVLICVIAELVWKRAGYSNVSGAILACGFFNIWMWGNYLPLFIDPVGYFAARTEFGADYEAALTALLPTWMCPTLLVVCFISGIAGGFLGRSLLKKHFVKAGIA